MSGVVDWELGAIGAPPFADIYKFPLSYGAFLDRAAPAGSGVVSGHPGRHEIGVHWSRYGDWPNLIGFAYAFFGQGWFPTASGRSSRASWPTSACREPSTPCSFHVPRPSGDGPARPGLPRGIPTGPGRLRGRTRQLLVVAGRCRGGLMTRTSVLSRLSGPVTSNLAARIGALASLTGASILVAHRRAVRSRRLRPASRAALELTGMILEWRIHGAAPYFLGGERRLEPRFRSTMAAL